MLEIVVGCVIMAVSFAGLSLTLRSPIGMRMQRELRIATVLCFGVAIVASTAAILLAVFS